MATFNNNWLALTVLIVHALLATSYAEHTISMKEFETCVKQLDDECGKEMFLKIFFGDGNVTLNCCSELAGMGKSCHDTLVEGTLSTSPQYRKFSKAILERSQSTWSQCLSMVKSASPHNRSCPPLSDQTCAKQIFSRIFHSQGELSNDCCGALVRIGKGCHNKLVDKQIAKAKPGSKKTQILHGSTSVWNWCSYIAPSLPSLKECEAKIDNKCGQEIGLSIFYGKGHVLKECCSKLANMGPECHDRWIRTILTRPQFAKRSDAILDASTKVWKKCASHL